MSTSSPPTRRPWSASAFSPPSMPNTSWTGAPKFSGNWPPCRPCTIRGVTLDALIDKLKEKVRNEVPIVMRIRRLIEQPDNAELAHLITHLGCGGDLQPVIDLLDRTYVEWNGYFNHDMRLIDQSSIAAGLVWLKEAHKRMEAIDAKNIRLTNPRLCK